MNAKTSKTAPSALLTEEEEEEYPLIYNLWIENLTINMAENSTIIMQTGRPKDPPPGP